MSYTPTDKEVLQFINKHNITKISQVSKIWKQTVIEILKYKNR